jgi:ADP-heptose:LPS heptosyltransferase
MYLLYAPEKKFGKLPPKTPLISDEVLFTNNIAYCPKFFWHKYHVLQGCLDVTPNWLKRKRAERALSAILVIAGGGIGDSLWIMPFTKALQQKHPAAKIIVMTNERAMPIWQNVPYCSACVKDEFWNMQSLIRRAEEVYDFSGIATYMKKAMKMDPVDATFKYGGLPLPRDKKDCRAMLVLNIDEGKRAEALLKREGINTETDEIVTIALDTSTSNRNWPFEHVKELTKMLIKEGYKVIWLGQNEAWSTKNLDLDTIEIGAVNLVARTQLREAMAIIALTDVFVGSSSGLLCIATAMEIPSVGLWGAYDPKCRDKYYIKWKPIWHKLDCAPCAEHWTECRKGHPAPCMKIIQPLEVFDAVCETHLKYPRAILEKRPIE